MTGDEEMPEQEADSVDEAGEAPQTIEPEGIVISEGC